MGSVSRLDACEKFIFEFGPELIAQHSHFYNGMNCFLEVFELNESVWMFVAVSDDKILMDHHTCYFDPNWEFEDLVDSLTLLLNLTPDVAKNRLLRAGLVHPQMD